jgi:hypothetical protein
VADLIHLSQSSGPEPQLSGHLATKNYVDIAILVTPLASSTRTGGYTITAVDAGVEQIYNSTSAGTFTLPTDASASIAVGRSIPLRQSNTGQLTVAAASGATLVSRGSAFKLAGQHAVAEVRKVGSNSWLLYGDITT